MTSILQVTGLVLILLGIAHIAFDRFFKWNRDLQAVAKLTREVFWVHHFFVALTVTLMGLLCLTSAPDLQSTPLGNQICLGFSAFWFCRLMIQFFGYSPSLWKGKLFETTVHIIFSLLWLYLTLLFLKLGIS